MKRLVDISTGETLMRGLDDKLTFYDVIEIDNPEFKDPEYCDDIVTIGKYAHYLDDLYLLNEEVRFFRVRADYEEEWFGYYDPEPLTLDDIQEYATDSDEPIEKLMNQVEEI